MLFWVAVLEGGHHRAQQERAGMEGLTPTQQRDEEQDNLMGGPGPTQRSGSGGGATGSVEDNKNEGIVHRNTLANPSASSRSVHFPEVE